MPDIEAVASGANMIVNGYAFTSAPDGRVRVLNLNAPLAAAVLDRDGRVLETTMDDIEAGIVLGYYRITRSSWRPPVPKYFQFMVAGYYLYFTSFCIVECMHVHASDRRLTESGSAKFFVKENGDSVVQSQGSLTDREALVIKKFIKKNYREMYLKWREYSPEGFYEG